MWRSVKITLRNVSRFDLFLTGQILVLCFSMKPEVNLMISNTCGEIIISSFNALRTVTCKAMTVIAAKTETSRRLRIVDITLTRFVPKSRRIWE